MKITASMARVLCGWRSCKRVTKGGRCWQHKAKLPPYPPGSRFDSEGRWTGFRCQTPNCEHCAAERES